MASGRSSLGRYLDCLRLNARVAGLALRGKWLSGQDVSASYDHIAASYDERWLAQLETVTHGLLDRVRSAGVGGSGTVLDLGCGTGFSTIRLARLEGVSAVTGVDISPGMLERAEAALAEQSDFPERPEQPLRSGQAEVSFVCADMLPFLRQCPDNSVSVLFSGWAMGYSRSAKVLREAHRVLEPGGVFAFVVNLADTLAPVFRAYRECMARYPDRVQRAAWPVFPKSHDWLMGQARSAGFQMPHQEEGRHPIILPEDVDSPVQWLLGTGVLGGFDCMLPLGRDKDVASFFDQTLLADTEPLTHHYSMALCRAGDSRSGNGAGQGA